MRIPIILTTIVITLMSCEKPQGCMDLQIEYEEKLNTYNHYESLYGGSNNNEHKTLVDYHKMEMKKAEQDMNKCLIQ